ncbi:hypothetical protein [Calothrix sp. PCC 6303]|uniref:hypothetical protein n=1 Tax=Calothrix sp. PCC 6303 TaxID=1170562 RepID=UPI0002A03BB5|nr:hypothetical protein [Calothrix sp. PCC 6303]AFY99826.1 hypothetical protein Cal6303_0759 [Calothrix sp. PCC 6303]
MKSINFSLKKEYSNKPKNRQKNKSLWKPSDTILMGGLLAAGIISVCTIVPPLFSSFSSSFSLMSSEEELSEQHPTSIHWLQNRAECERSKKTWSDGKCWDAEHNLMF